MKGIDILMIHQTPDPKNTIEDGNTSSSKPYMGNLTSAQIGSMAKAGVLGGEMVRRMIKDQEIKMMNQLPDE